MTRGDFEGAARAFQRAADAHPDDPRPWLSLGRAEMAAERFERARDAFTHVTLLRPHAALPRVLIGNCWELSRRYDEALLAYRQAVLVAPRSAYAHRMLGTRLLRWGRPEAAVPPLARAAALDPSHAETWNALGLARHGAGDEEGAEQAFREGIAQHPGHLGLRLGLAAMLVNAHRFAEALEAYDEVVARAPTFAPAHVGRALLLDELGRMDEAEAAFERAVEVARNPARFQRRLEAYRAPSRQPRRLTRAHRPPYAAAVQKVRWPAAIAALLVGVLLASIASPADAQRRRRRRRGPPEPATLTLQTTVQGAEVLIDEEYVGMTPLESPVTLQPGSHTIRVRRAGYTEFTDVVEAHDGEQIDLPVDLIALSMVLTVRSEPDEARVFVDGTFRGNTPIELELIEGDHSLRVTHPGHREAIRQITAVAGQTDVVDVTLEVIPPEELAATHVPEWYEEPLVWIVAGASLAAIAAVIIIVAVATQGGSQISDYCGGAAEQSCIRVMPEWTF